MEPDRRHHLSKLEDETALRDIVSRSLEKRERLATSMGRAGTMAWCADRLRPDSVPLDAGLPGLAGREACRRLRAAVGQVRAILPAAANEDTDRGPGFATGAETPPAKPCPARASRPRIHGAAQAAGPVSS